MTNSIVCKQWSFGEKSLLTLTTHGSTILHENQKWMIAATITQNLPTFPFFRFPFEQFVSVSRILRWFNNNLSKNCQSKSGILANKMLRFPRMTLLSLWRITGAIMGGAMPIFGIKYFFYRDKTTLAIGRKYEEILWMETLFQCPVIKLVSNKNV